MADKIVQVRNTYTGETADQGYSDLDGGTTYGPKVALPGRLVTLLAATTLTVASVTSNSTAVTGLDKYTGMNIQMTISAKSLAGGGTVNLYVQGSIDAGTKWFDIKSSTQITNAAMANGVYQVSISAIGSSIGPTAAVVADGTLAAGSIRAVPFGDRLRVKIVPASFGANDVVTIAVVAWMVP
jgi:hypothetical protein